MARCRMQYVVLEETVVRKAGEGEDCWKVSLEQELRMSGMSVS